MPEQKKEDQSWEYPVKWREFRHIVEGLKVRAKGHEYSGPQAHWVNPIWEEIIIPAVASYVTKTEEAEPNSSDKSPVEVTKGSAKHRLTSLNAFNKED